MKKLLVYIKPYWVAALLAPLFMLIEVYMDLLQPKLMASIVDHGVMKGDLAHVQQTGVWMLIVALVGLAGGVGCTIFSTIAAQNFGADIRESLFQKVQTFSFRDLDRFKAGTLVTRLTGDIVQLQTLVQMMLRIMIRAPFLALGSIIMALAISPRLALILAVVVPLLFFILYFLIRMSFPLFSKVQAKLDGINTVLQENLSSIRVVKAFVRSNFERKRFDRANRDYMTIALKASRLVALNMPIMTLLLNASIVVALWFGGIQIRSGNLQVGDLIAFLNYMTQVLFSLLMISRVMVSVSSAKASADRVNEVLAIQPDIIDHAKAKKHVIHSGRVMFENVAFAYDTAQNEWVLQDINFVAEPGQTIAILGATGAGKSSLVQLVPRLYDTTYGRVLIDGVDVRDIELHHLRSHIGMVLQQSILFSGTIRDTIRFGKPDASQEEVEAAARAAEAHDFIMSFPDGYDTKLGQRGINLSGGQKQRLSIARTLLIRPTILLLDDSTSAIDVRTESRIQASLKEVMAHSTCFIIAQRISSVFEADKIIVLEEGRIAAQGTHAELLRKSSVYQDIYQSQLGKEADIFDYGK